MGDRIDGSLHIIAMCGQETNAYSSSVNYVRSKASIMLVQRNTTETLVAHSQVVVVECVKADLWQLVRVASSP